MAGILTDSALVDALFLIIIIIFLLYQNYTKHYMHWKNKNIFYVEPSFPFGNWAKSFLNQAPRFKVAAEYYTDIKVRGYKYGGTFHLADPVLLIVDPYLIKAILIKDFDCFVDRGLENINLDKRPIARNLFSVNENQDWKRLRQKLTRTFTSGKIKYMFRTMQSCSKELVLHVQECLQISDHVNVKNMCECFTIDIIGSTAFGIEINSLRNPNAEFRQTSLKLFQRSSLTKLKTIILSAFPEFGLFFNLTTMDKGALEFITRTVTNNVAYREENHVQRPDFLDLLIDLKNSSTSDDFKFTVVDIAAQVLVFFIAGFHTSSVAMSLCLYELAGNKAIQDRLREEIMRVTKENNGEVTYDSIKTMKYLDKVAKETLRKYPSLPQLNRKSTRSYTLPESDITLDRGTRVLIPVYAIHNDPEYYPDPDKFDPERFEPEAIESRPPFTYLPFGDGPRNCIGLRFGIVQFKLGLISLLSKYEFLPNDNPQELKFNSTNLLIVVEQMQLKIRNIQ